MGYTLLLAATYSLLCWALRLTAARCYTLLFAQYAVKRCCSLLFAGLHCLSVNTPLICIGMHCCTRLHGAIRCYALPYAAICCCTLLCVAIRRETQLYAAMRCYTLLFAAIRWYALLYVVAAFRCYTLLSSVHVSFAVRRCYTPRTFEYPAIRCISCYKLVPAVTCCNTPLHVAIRCYTLLYGAIRCYTLL